MKEKQLLLELRSKLVASMHVKPFTIYNDATIEELLRAKPASLAELEKVKGFPKNGKRIAGFGEAIVAIFAGEEIETFEIANDGGFSVEPKVQKMEAF